MSQELGPLDARDVMAWLERIPLSAWPQQHRVDEQLRPAMVNDMDWNDFGRHTDALVAEILGHFPGASARNRMLSVVMPGHDIFPHCDAQPPGWLTRVHVPLVTNDRAVTLTQGQTLHMRAGLAYLVDTRREHAVRNDGPTPRIHFMVDVHE